MSIATRWLTIAGISVAALCTGTADAQDTYGIGTAGAGGIIPELSCTQAWLGNPGFDISVDKGVGGGVAVQLIAALPWSFNVGGTMVLVDPGTLILTTAMVLGGPPGVPGAGSANSALPLTGLDSNPSLVGAWIYGQALVLDAALPGSVAATPGLAIELTLPPLIFAATSQGPSSREYFIDPLAQTQPWSSVVTGVNTRGAVFTNGGADLHIARGGAIMHADMGTGVAPVWSTIALTPGDADELQYDPSNKLFWTLSGTSMSALELIAFDGDPGSPTYGQVYGQTSGLAPGSLLGFWALSPSGKRAGVMGVLSNIIHFVDTDPSSPTFLQVTGSTIVPAQSVSISVLTGIRFTPDDASAVVLIQYAGQTPAEVARLDLTTMTWVDHNPTAFGIQHIGNTSVPIAPFGSAPIGFDMSQDGRFAVISGWSGTGWIGRLDLDPTDIAFWQWTSWQPGVSLENAWALEMSRDEASVAVGSWSSGSGGTLHLLGTQNGSLMGSISLSANIANIYELAFR